MSDADNLSGLDELATLRGRPALYLNGGFDWDCVGAVREISTQLNPGGNLTVLLNSPGGDIECAYRAILALRDRVDDMEVLVPIWAKSAATFFCLAADSIHMGRYGELGPLDPQIPDRSGRARPVSALETFKALEHILRYSMESFNHIVTTMLRSTSMDVPHAIDNAPSLFEAIVSPLYQQVDPRELGESGQYLAISEEYAMRVMRRWAYSEMAEEERRGIAKKLVWDYPTHGFVIDLWEAQEIGIRAEKMDDEPDAMCIGILATLGEGIRIGFPYETAEAGAEG